MCKILPLTSFSASKRPFRKSTFLVYSVRTSCVGLLYENNMLYNNNISLIKTIHIYNDTVVNSDRNMVLPWAFP